MNETNCKKEFNGVWLYLKVHSSGMKYFGCTSRKDVFKYKGSGSKWIKLIKTGSIETVWAEFFTDEEKLKETAKHYSDLYDLGNNPEFANVYPETGMYGLPKGIKLNATIKHNMSIAKSKEKNPMFGKYQVKITCEHCGKVIGANMYKRWHGDNCVDA